MRYPAQLPVFEVVETKYEHVARVGDVVEGTVDLNWEGKPYLAFYSAAHGHSAHAWHAATAADPIAAFTTELRPLNRAARELKKAILG